MHRSGAKKWIANVAGEAVRQPSVIAQSKPQRFVFGQAKRGACASTNSKSVGNRRLLQNQPAQLPVICGSGFEFVKNAACRQMISIVEKSLANGGEGLEMTPEIPTDWP